MHENIQPTKHADPHQKAVAIGQAIDAICKQRSLASTCGVLQAMLELIAEGSMTIDEVIKRLEEIASQGEP
jgi:Zn/Cd-binding protein ZinT